MFGATLALKGAIESVARDVGPEHPFRCPICMTIERSRFETWLYISRGYVFNYSYNRWEKERPCSEQR